MSQHDPYGPATGPLHAPAPPPADQPGYGYGYGFQGHDQHGYPAAGSPPPGYGYGYDLGPQRTNVMAILGLVFAFLCSPLGIVFSAIGLGQIRKRGQKGRGLALTGLILSIVFLLIGVLFAVFVAPAATKAVNTAADSIRASSSASAEAPGAAPSGAGGAADTGSAAGSSGTGVAGACSTIIPALTNLEADMQDVHTAAQYSRTLATLESTLRTAAGGASDQQFQQDVAQLNADLDKASAAVQSGKDPSSLEKALADDAAAVAESCAMAGVTD